MNSKAEIGRRGEEAAIAYLRNNGFLICDRNWRCGRYEIDIVAQRRGVTHFVEVKTRKAASLTTPEQAITPNKVAAIHHAVTAYLAQRQILGDIEIELIAVDIFPNGECDMRFISNIAERGW